MYEWKVTQNEQGQRLDVFVATLLTECTRSRVQKLILLNNINVNGSSAKSNYKLREGDLVTVVLPPPEELSLEPEEMSLDIVYEDSELLVLNKPQGMVVHPAPGHWTNTLVHGLMHHCRDSLSGINGTLRPGIVHRIDRDTSGLLVVAKNDRAHQYLAEQFSVHSITRQYQALVIGRLKQSRGTIDRPIARHPADRKKMWIAEQGGRRAVTHYEVQEVLKGISWIQLTLETGRTHQIRVHMASMGHPVLGDPVYGGIRKEFILSGQALHAGVLGFCHPVSREYMEFQAALPSYFVDLLRRMDSSIGRICD